MRACAFSVALCVCSAIAAPALAQAPAEPKVLTVALSAGFALTSGNTDTSQINVAYEVTFQAPTRNIIKSDALFLRGKTADVVSANRLSIKIRDEYSVSPRTFVFGQNQYLRDEFKNIDFLMAPTFGAGFKLFDTEATKLAVDASAGGVWEKNPASDAIGSGAVTVSEKLTQTLTSTSTATLTQSLAALWKTNDFEDALYTAGIGVAAAITTRTQLKVEILDTFKNKPPDPTVQKNDVAVLMAIVYKM